MNLTRSLMRQRRPPSPSHLPPPSPSVLPASVVHHVIGDVHFEMRDGFVDIDTRSLRSGADHLLGAFDCGIACVVKCRSAAFLAAAVNRHDDELVNGRCHYENAAPAS